MEYSEDDYLMLSGIQHFKFCRRQWALIHIEQQWAENVHTVVGELMHKTVHDPYLVETRKGCAYSQGHYPLYQEQWESAESVMLLNFVRARTESNYTGTGVCFLFIRLNIKRENQKLRMRIDLQLTAQAMCLEEMFSTKIERGALFYGETRRREEL